MSRVKYLLKSNSPQIIYFESSPHNGDGYRSTGLEMPVLEKELSEDTAAGGHRSGGSGKGFAGEREREREGSRDTAAGGHRRRWLYKYGSRKGCAGERASGGYSSRGP